MEKETALPKNIRQIGEVRGEEKICLEDYVMTCIHKKEQQEKEGYLGVFFGERRQEGEAEYVFIRGILELSKTWEAEDFAEKLEKQRVKYFPDWTVQGCCVIGAYDTERIREVRSRIEDAGHIVYHLQEQEETLYAQRDGTYHKIKGYFIFYEQNRKMQTYLSDEFKEDRVEKESFPDKAIKSFREKVRIKSERKSGSMLKMASSFFVVTVLAVAAVTVTKMDDLKKVRQTLNGVDDTAENEAQDNIYMDTAGMGEKENSEGNTTGNTAGAGGENGTGSTAVAGMSESAPENTAAGASGSVLENSAAGASEDRTESAAGASESALENTAAGASGSVLENSAAGASKDGMESTAAGASESVLENSAAGASEDRTESAAAGASESAPENTAAGASESVLENSAAGASEDRMESAAAGASEDRMESTASDRVAGGNMTASEGLAAAGENAASALQSASARGRSTQATYTIREGDTLADICSKYYGNFDKLDLICSANGITDANLILPGQKIVLP